MARIPAKEIVDANKKLTSKAFALLMYYYTKSENWQWDDKVTAHDLGLTTRKVREYRNELIKEGYLYIAKGNLVNNVFIGRQAVTDLHAGELATKNIGTEITKLEKINNTYVDPFSTRVELEEED